MIRIPQTLRRATLLCCLVLLILQDLYGQALPALIPYRKGNLWGYCDSAKRVILPAKWLSAGLFRRGRAEVIARDSSVDYGGDAVCRVDTNGAYIVPPSRNWDGQIPDMGWIGKFDSLRAISARFVYSDLTDTWIESSKDVDVRYPRFNAVHPVTKAAGIIDSNNTELVPLMFDRNGQQTWLYDRQRRKLYFMGSRNGKYAIIDTNHRIVLPFKYESIRYIERDTNGIALIAGTPGGKERLVNERGKSIIKGDYSGIIYYGGLYRLMRDNKHGLASPRGKIIFPVKYHSITVLPDSIELRMESGGELKIATATKDGTYISAFRPLPKPELRHSYRHGPRAHNLWGRCPSVNGQRVCNFDIDKRTYHFDYFSYRNTPILQHPDGYFLLKNESDGKWAVTDANLRIVLRPQQHQINSAVPNAFVIALDGGFSLMDTSGKVLSKSFRGRLAGYATDDSGITVILGRKELFSFSDIEEQASVVADTVINADGRAVPLFNKYSRFIAFTQSQIAALGRRDAFIAIDRNNKAGIVTVTGDTLFKGISFRYTTIDVLTDRPQHHLGGSYQERRHNSVQASYRSMRLTGVFAVIDSLGYYGYFRQDGSIPFPHLQFNFKHLLLPLGSGAWAVQKASESTYSHTYAIVNDQNQPLLPAKKITNFEPVPGYPELYSISTTDPGGLLYMSGSGRVYYDEN